MGHSPAPAATLGRREGGCWRAAGGGKDGCAFRQPSHAAGRHRGATNCYLFFLCCWDGTAAWLERTLNQPAQLLLRHGSLP